MTVVIISITDRCDFCCKMCDIGQKNISSGLYENLLLKGELSPNNWKKIIIETLGVTEINIQGVEPLLYSSLDSLLASFSKRYIIRLTTNEWLIDKWFDTLKDNCDEVTISIDGLKETHDRIRGVEGAFDRAYAGMVRLRNVGCHVRVSFAITPDNLSDIIPLYDTIVTEKKNIPIVFNHYNYIHPSSCKGFDCKTTNLSYYDISQINIDKIQKAISHCKNSYWNPYLKTKKEIEEYYMVHPVTYKKTMQGCIVIRQELSGERYVINSDGKFIISARCWINCDKAKSCLERDTS